MALTNLYKAKNAIIESLMVIGYDPSHSTASIEVNAPLKILSVLIRCLNNEILQEKIKEKKTNIDDPDFDFYGDTQDDGRMEMDDEGVDQQDNELRPEEKVDESKPGNESEKVEINLDEFNDLAQEEINEAKAKLNFIVFYISK